MIKGDLSIYLTCLTAGADLSRCRPRYHKEVIRCQIKTVPAVGVANLEKARAVAVRPKEERAAAEGDEKVPVAVARVRELAAAARVVAANLLARAPDEPSSVERRNNRGQKYRHHLL